MAGYTSLGWRLSHALNLQTINIITLVPQNWAWGPWRSTRQAVDARQCLKCHNDLVVTKMTLITLNQKATIAFCHRVQFRTLIFPSQSWNHSVTLVKTTSNINTSFIYQLTCILFDYSWFLHVYSSRSQHIYKHQLIPSFLTRTQNFHGKSVHKFHTI